MVYEAQIANPAYKTNKPCGLPVARLTLQTAIFLPEGNGLAQLCEQVLPNQLPWGSFLVVSGHVIA